LAKERQPDLIVLDLLPADGAGADLFEELKSTPETESIPVMVLTRMDAEDVPGGLRDRAEAFQTLPVGPATLLEKIEALLDPRR
jgi:DNA-binding response OmpR family regulator